MSEAEHIEAGGPLPPWPIDAPIRIAAGFDAADRLVIRGSAWAFVAAVLILFAESML